MARDQSTLPAIRNRQQGLIPFTQDDLLSPSLFFESSPFQLMRRMQEDLNRMFGSAFAPTTGGLSGSQGTQIWSPTVDVSEDDKEYRIEVDLPGVNKDSIDVQIQNGQLRIRAGMKQETQDGSNGQNKQQQQQQQQYHIRERRAGYFERVFTLPDDVDENAIRCEYRDGVLFCHLQKSEQAAKAGRQIPIEDGSANKQRSTTQQNQEQQKQRAA